MALNSALRPNLRRDFSFHGGFKNNVFVPNLFKGALLPGGKFISLESKENYLLLSQLIPISRAKRFHLIDEAKQAYFVKG